MVCDSTEARHRPQVDHRKARAKIRSDHHECSICSSRSKGWLPGSWASNCGDHMWEQEMRKIGKESIVKRPVPVSQGTSTSPVCALQVPASALVCFTITAADLAYCCSR